MHDQQHDKRQLDPAWQATPFTAGGITHEVYCRGDQSHPSVIIIHELPGMTPECIRFAEEVVAAGFRVHLPLLFGAPNDEQVLLNFVRVVRLCIRREFRLFSRHESGLITEWLRAYANAIHDPHCGRGVGAIGMCLTGGFALAMMIAPSAVAAPVLSQPALPFLRPTSLGVSEAACEATRQWVQEQKAHDPHFAIPAYRFVEDRLLCPQARFRHLQDELGAENVAVFEITKEARQKAEIPDNKTHSVLTGYSGNNHNDDPTAQARREVITYLNEQLRL